MAMCAWAFCCPHCVTGRARQETARGTSRKGLSSTQHPATGQEKGGLTKESITLQPPMEKPSSPSRRPNEKWKFHTPPRLSFSHRSSHTRHPPVVSRIGRRTFIVPQGEPGVRQPPFWQMVSVAPSPWSLECPQGRNTCKEEQKAESPPLPSSNGMY